MFYNVLTISDSVPGSAEETITAMHQKILPTITANLGRETDIGGNMQAFVLRFSLSSPETYPFLITLATNVLARFHLPIFWVAEKPSSIFGCNYVEKECKTAVERLKLVDMLCAANNITFAGLDSGISDDIMLAISCSGTADLPTIADVIPKLRSQIEERLQAAQRLDPYNSCFICCPRACQPL
jgi:hypothetical protein